MKKIVALMAAFALGVGPSLAAAAQPGDRPPDNRPPDNRPPAKGGGGGGGDNCELGVVLDNDVICLIR